MPIEMWTDRALSSPLEIKKNNCKIIWKLNKMFLSLHSKPKHKTLIDVILFIGTMGVISMIFGKLKEYFVDEPTIKLKITKTVTK